MLYNGVTRNVEHVDTVGLAVKRDMLLWQQNAAWLLHLTGTNLSFKPMSKLVAFNVMPLGKVSKYAFFLKAALAL